MKKFWEFKALGNAGELFLYGEISDETWYGDEVTPVQFQKDLAALGDISTLDVYVNSPGGDVFAGFTIYNIIKRHAAAVTVHVDGLAASAASVICMAADKIIMPKNATMMIHNAASIVWGNKADLRKMAEELERIDGQLADIYADRCKKKPEDCAALMDAETWMSGEEALELGFCDEVEENKQIAACADSKKFFAHYKHAPELEEEKKDAIAKNDGVTAHFDSSGKVVITANAVSVGAMEPNNGGESQPVEDKLREQRARFNAARIKIMEGITNV